MLMQTFSEIWRIYRRLTTEFGYAKRDIRLAAYSGIVLQRFVSRKR